MRRLAATLDAVKATRSRTEKVALLAELLATLTDDELTGAARVIVAQPLAVGDDRSLGVGWALLLEATAAASGRTERELMVGTRAAGDFGEALEPLWPTDRKGLPLTRVIPFFEALASTTDRLEKVKLVTQTLHDATGAEAKYSTRRKAASLRLSVLIALTTMNSTAAMMMKFTATVRKEP